MILGQKWSKIEERNPTMNKRIERHNHMYVCIYVYKLYSYTHTRTHTHVWITYLAKNGRKKANYEQKNTIMIHHRPQNRKLPACMYVCMYVRMYVRGYIFQCIYMYICVYHYDTSPPPKSKTARLYVCVYVCVCTWVCLSVYICTYVLF